MKRLAALLLIASLPAFFSCNFSAGYKKDIATGLSYKYSGLRVTNVVLVSPENKAMTDNKVRINTQISVVAFGVSNYELKDGKVFPGMMLSVTDKNGASVLHEDDLLAGGNGYPPEKAAEMVGLITVGKPMVTGETYLVKLHIWDKLKPAKDLNIEVSIVVGE